MPSPSPLANQLVTVFGGSGFLGRHVAQALLQRGARVRIASRNPEKAYTLKPLANLGQLQFARCDAADRRNVEACLTGADAVVNLVGSFDGDLERLMGEAPGWMAEAATAQGAAAFVHVSAIAPLADDEARYNAYAEAKHLGERQVMAAYPTAAGRPAAKKAAESARP